MNNIRGWVGLSKTRGVTGWLADLSQPDRICHARILINETEVMVMPADRLREHLAERGMSNPNHGFEMPLPKGLSPDEIEAIVVEAVEDPSFRTKAKLGGSFRWSDKERTTSAPLMVNREGSERTGTSQSADRQSEIETLKAKNADLVRFLDNRREEVKTLKAQKQTAEKLTRQSDRLVRDAAAKMWGGYSETGRKTLLSIANSPATPGVSKAKANFALACHNADTGRIQMANRHMAQARRASTGFMRQLRPRLLEADLLMRIGDLETARQRLEEYHAYQPEDPNYRVALANLARLDGDMDGMRDVLNAMLAVAGLTPIAWDDPDAPFLSLRNAADPVPVEGGPRVSILMSSYNAADYLRFALGSMQAQTWRNIEILVTDDCSTDDSRAILRDIASKDPRVTIIENEENLGTYGNRNKMLARCTGTFVTVHDADDWSHPQMIERQVRHLLETPDIRINTTLMCRVSQDLSFQLRPSRNALEYCHMNYPGFMMRTDEVRELGGWDPIMANADAEFERRVKQVHGREAFAIIDCEVPYSFFLVHENSLTQQKTMNLRSLSFGSRSEYHRQSEHWLAARRAAAESSEDEVGPFVLDGRTDRQQPFPCPNSLMIPSLKREVQEFDVLILSDLFLLGGTRGCNLNYIRALNAMGKRVALFHWPRADLLFLPDVNAAYRDMKQQGLVDIVTWEDSIRADRVILHHPPAAAQALDSYPRIEAGRVSVLVNQLPFQTTERDQTFYDPLAVEGLLCQITGTDTVEWIAISPLTRDYLMEWAEDIRIRDDIWYPPYVAQPDFVTRSTAERLEAFRTGAPRAVRHTRDHWTKWPVSAAQIRAAYMTEAGLDMTVLGGGKAVGQCLGAVPEHWTVHAYDSISVPDLLNSGDVYLNFNNPIYIEEFGRNIMEAMAFGLPVIADAVFTRVFGDAILPVEDHQSAPVLDRLRRDPVLFEEQVARGHEFVARNCSDPAVRERMARFLD